MEEYQFILWLEVISIQAIAIYRTLEDRVIFSIGGEWLIVIAFLLCMALAKSLKELVKGVNYGRNIKRHTTCNACKRLK